MVVVEGMKKAVIGLVLLAAVAAGVYVYRGRFERRRRVEPGRGGRRRRRRPGSRAAAAGAAAGAGGFGGGQFGRPPLTVELGKAARATIQSEITVVGNLIGQATVSVASRAAGRVESRQPCGSAIA